MNVLNTVKTIAVFFAFSAFSVSAQTLVKVETVEQTSLTEIAEFYLEQSMKVAAENISVTNELTIEVAVNEASASNNEETVSLVNYAD